MRLYVRSLMTRDAGNQMVRLALIGVLNTISYFVLFNVARTAGASLFWSVTIAFGLSTLMSYVLNRRWTFGLADNSGGIMETVRFFAVNVVAWGLTVAIVTGADRLLGPMGLIGENIASLVAAAIILVPKFASYRDLVFRRALHHEHGVSRTVRDGVPGAN